MAFPSGHLWYLEERRSSTPYGCRATKCCTAPLLIRPVGRPPKRPTTSGTVLRVGIVRGWWRRWSGIGESCSQVHRHEHDGCSKEWCDSTLGILIQDSAVVRSLRLSLFILAYNLFLRRLVCPRPSSTGRCGACSLIKMGGRLVRHSRRLIFQLSEVSVPRGCSRECWIVSADYRRRQAEGGYNHDFAKRESAPGSRLVQCAFTPLMKTQDMVHGENRIPYRIDQRTSCHPRDCPLSLKTPIWGIPVYTS